MLLLLSPPCPLPSSSPLRAARCLDLYFEQRAKQSAASGGDAAGAVSVDKRLVAIVERMVKKCCDDGQFEQAVGIALEGRRLDLLESIIAAAGAWAPPAAAAGADQQQQPTQQRVLKYSLRVCQQLVVSRELRQQVLRLLIRQYEAAAAPDWVEICQCLQFLDEPTEVAAILHRLFTGSEDDALLAYQVGFDLVENEVQAFLGRVQAALDDTVAAAAPAPQPAAPPPAPPPAAAAAAAGDNGAAAMETDGAPAAAPAAAAAAPSAAAAAAAAFGDAYAKRSGHMRDILSGKTPIGLCLDFLYRHNKADLQILKNIKTSVDGRVSVLHSATVLANAYMHAGTTVDTFLRENLDWLSRATNWAKFGATAGLGVIHRGHLAQGRALMAPYLPRPGGGPAASAYSEGGALYALGLIYANHGADVKPFLLEALRGAGGEVAQHGGCLGLGLAGLGTCDEECVEDVKNVLYTDSAVAGEAAGIGLGLLLAGSGSSERAAEMLAYAHDTQHEKIIRGLATGLALVMYGREEGAETLIEQMCRDQDPIIRYGAMYVIGLAYRGTDNNAAIQKLLHYAVSDVSDDVRRAAVLCLGFVLMNVPEQCPAIVALLAESYNPHVRYGAAMALGLACAGTGLKDASALLEPLLSDAVDFVRQGALIASALVLMQQPEARVAPFRKRLDKSIGDKHEETMAKMGSIMAAGILDAGGRNVCVGLRSRSGYFRRTSVLGLAVFTQYWYWYPLAHFLPLAFAPTAVVALDGELKMPVVELHCAAKPSLYAYPPPVTTEAKEAAAKLPTAVLSTTAKAKERAAKKKEAERRATGGGAEAAPAAGAAAAAAAGAPKDSSTAMETDEAKASSSAAGGDAAAAATNGKAKEPAAPEPTSFSISNPGRVLPHQAKVVSFKADSRWEPVKRDAPPVGILVLRDLQPGQPVEYVSVQTAAAPAAAATTAAAAAAAPATTATTAAAAEAEPPPPEPFEYNPQ